MKQKYIIAVVATTLILIISLYSINHYQTRQYPISTGGDKPQEISSEYINEAQAIKELDSLLPLKTDNFTIDFDYKKGMYIVTSTSTLDIQTNFDEWHYSSQFKAIPRDRFYFLSNTTEPN